MAAASRPDSALPDSTAESVSAPSAATDPTPFGPREQLAVWVLLGSAFVVILNETIMGVALPRLMDALSISASAGQWLTTAFLLTMSVVIPITGMLIQRIRTRTLFIAAMGFFTLGTAIAAAAPGFEMLLVGRVVQACGTAIMMPLLMTTVITVVPEASRGRLMGRISIVISVAPALGPTISGVILEHFEWRWLFILVLPISLAALIIGALRMPNVGEPRRAPIDALSVLLSLLGFGGLVYGLSAVGELASGGSSMPPWIPVVIGAVSLVWFVLRQLSLQRQERALLDLRTFRSRPFAFSVLLFACASLALFGSLILLPIFVQRVLGLSVFEAGLSLLPGGLVMGLLGPIVGRLVDRRGARPVLIPGTIITAIGLWGMGLFGVGTPLWFVILTHVVMSVGLAATFTPLFTVSLGSLPHQLASYGSAMIGTVQQVAGAAGTALFVTLMTLVSVAHAESPTSVGAAALASGTHVAFLVGGAVATLGIVVALFVRDPAPQAQQVPVGH
ncbi:MFS transporter [Leucobacter sp. OAMLP11]|uniref:MDR family MFS transporter n=1 Tax=unclassified Leucobacter TaxID=2621730 RepID=UPI000C1958F2|nr:MULTISPECIES: MDR family MFS transporter [unclassified Leucobacter]PIO50923.1 MFS transporter [Leucobacter sp. OAMLP11]